jgi:hypothetical protein
MPDFIPGLELCRLFYREAIAPILETDFPGLRYSAALIGSGSEVLGFDTALSSDHDWGPRAQLFLREDDYSRTHQALMETLRHKLPPAFRGYPTDFRSEEPSQMDGINHRAAIGTVRGFFLDYLDLDMDRDIQPADWLTLPQQRLRAVTAGAVYHDAIGLQAVRDRLAYYPPDVWLYLLAAGWSRIAEEEHLMGRAGSVGDEIGSALIAARLVRDLMRLCFLMEKQYAPYPKWFGTAFSRLECAQELAPILRRVLLAESWQEREAHLSAAYEIVAAKHNALGITAELPAKVAPFFSRPFQVIHLDGGFADAIRAQIQDPVVKHIAAKRLIGSIDLFSDSTAMLEEVRWRRTLRSLYEVPVEG